MRPYYKQKEALLGIVGAVREPPLRALRIFSLGKPRYYFARSLKFEEGGLDFFPNLFERIRANQERYGQYPPMIQFILDDKKNRTFQAERVGYGGAADGWLPIRFYEPLPKLVKELIPLLRTDSFYELYL